MSGSGSIVAASPARIIGWSSITRTRIGAFGKILPQGPPPQRHVNFHLRAVSGGAGYGAFAANIGGALPHVLQSPMAGFGQSLLQMEAGAIIGDGELQRPPTILQRDANLLRAGVPIGVVGRFLCDTQQ